MGADIMFKEPCGLFNISFKTNIHCICRLGKRHFVIEEVVRVRMYL